MAVGVKDNFEAVQVLILLSARACFAQEHRNHLPVTVMVGVTMMLMVVSMVVSMVMMMVMGMLMW